MVKGHHVTFLWLKGLLLAKTLHGVMPKLASEVLNFKVSSCLPFNAFNCMLTWMFICFSCHFFGIFVYQLMPQTK